VADWGQRAKDKDRDAAIKLIEAAAARGQIVDVDKTKRIQEVKTAGTVGEIELITRGLAVAPAAAAGVPTEPPPVSTPGPPVNPTFQQYAPPTAPRVTEPDPTPPPAVQYGEPLTPSAGTSISTPPMIKRSGGAGKLVLIIVLIVFAGIAVPSFFGIKALVDGIDELDGIDGIGGGDADVFSAEGFEEMIDAVEEETGTTEVFSLSMYPDYAVVDVPTESTGTRYIGYRFDGDLVETFKNKSTDDRRFDLRDLDVEVLQKVLADARKLVEDPTSNYVIVRPPYTDNAWISAYATNDFSETGYLTATLNGKIVMEYPPS